MNLSQVIKQHPGNVAMLFNTYGINQPVNRKTLSAAIALYSSANGNPFLQDLMSTLPSNDTNDYDEIFGLGKKGKQRRAEKREARGGYSRAGAILRKIGIAKNRPAKGAGGDGVNISRNNAVVDAGNENVEDKGQAMPKTKLTDVLDTAGQVITGAKGIADAISGGGSAGAADRADMGDNGGADAPQKKFPWLWVGIGAGALVLVIVLAMVFKAKKK